PIANRRNELKRSPISASTMIRPASIYRLSYIEFSAWTSQTFPELVRLRHTQSSARSAQMSLDSGTHPHSRPGSDYVQSNRSVGEASSTPKGDASKPVRRGRYGSEQTPYTMPKFIPANSSGKSPQSLPSRKRSLPQRTNFLALFFTS